MTSEIGSMYFGGLHYERRIVSFFDTLGWRAHINKAGTDPGRIAYLASLPRLFSSTVISLAEHMEGAHISSFSDNVVASIPYRPDWVLPSLEGLASVLVGAACMGFFLRGAVTIGDLFHDDQIVFGPALNRAYELESEEAVYPRILFDPLVSDFADITCDFVSKEEENAFLDPFHYSFIDRRLKPDRNVQPLQERWAEIAGFRGCIVSTSINAEQVLESILQKVQSEMEKATQAEVKKKYTWLYERVSSRIIAS